MFCFKDRIDRNKIYKKAKAIVGNKMNLPKEVIENYALYEMYPWLRWPKGSCSYAKNLNTYFDCTVLDLLPDGWSKSFKKPLCIDIQRAYWHMSKRQRKDFYIYKIKEKWGELIIRCSIENEEIINIQEKYRKLSHSVCQQCGNPATKLSLGYIGYWCDEHAPKYNKTLNGVRKD